MSYGYGTQWGPPMMRPPSLQELDREIDYLHHFKKEIEARGETSHQKKTKETFNKGLTLIQKSIVLTILSVPVGMIVSKWLILFTRDWAHTMLEVFPK